MLFKLFVTLSLLLLRLDAQESKIQKELYLKPPLSKTQLEKKREGDYFTGMPLLNYDADKGIGYGARVYLYNNGKRDETLFNYTPYRHKIYLQYFETTNGYSNHKLFLDSKYIADSLFHLNAELIYEKNTQANYFGVGASTLSRLTDTQNNSYKTASAQQKALDAQNSPYFNNYLLTQPKLALNLSRDFLGGLVRLNVGTIIEYATLKDYHTTTLSKKYNAESKLYNDREELIGANGGWDNGLKLSFVYDSRDYAPNPKNGSLFDFSTLFYGDFLGSDFTHQRYTLSLRHFKQVPNAKFITVALSALYSLQQGDTPFYNQNSIDFSDDFTTGLGGQETLRGYTQNRFVADVKALANLELRFNLYENSLFGQSFEYMFVPFLDSGKVFNSLEKSDLKGYKYSYGAGLRVAWNQATIIMLDYGVSVEDSGLYINFGHIF